MVLVGVGVVDRAGTSLNSKNGQVTPNGPKWGGWENCTPNFFGFGVICPWAQNGGCKLYPPCGPMWGSLPIVVVLGWGMGGEVAPWLGMGNGGIGWGRVGFAR